MHGSSTVEDTIVVVGASLAGVRAAESVRNEGFGGRLVVVGDEPHAPYDRPPLSKAVLLGELGPLDTAIPIAEDVGIEWLLGQRAVALNLPDRAIRLADGATLGFDGLVIATGSGPRTLPGFDADRESTFVLRNALDAVQLRAALAPGRRLLIVGAGFIGVEVASAATQLGLVVSMVCLDPPLATAGPLVSGAVSSMLDDAEVQLHVGRRIAAHRTSSAGHEVALDDGTTLVAEVVLIAVGAAPATDWLTDSTITVENGVLCDETLHAAPDVVAAGDVASWPNPLFGGRVMRIEHWSNAIEQGKAAGRALLHGTSSEPFASVPSFWSDHFGARLQSVGLPALADDFQVTDGEPDSGPFAVAAYRAGALIGALAYDMPRALIKHRAALIAGASV